MGHRKISGMEEMGWGDSPSSVKNTGSTKSSVDMLVSVIMELRTGWSLKRLGRFCISKLILKRDKVVVDKLALRKNDSNGWNSISLYSFGGWLAIK